jgi:hypothetical protein
MTDPRLFARFACRFHDRLTRQRQTHPTHPAVARLTGALARITRCQHRLDCVRNQGWSASVKLVTSLLLDEVDRLPALCPAASSAIEQASQVLASPRQILDDLIAVEAEFDAFTLDLGRLTLSVETDPITLDDLDLGSFRITLDLAAFTRGDPDDRVVTCQALDPNPPHNRDDVTHPHVSDDIPCLGDAAVPLRSALLGGRLFDAVTLIDRVLDTYNPGSAYRRIDDWHCVSCGDCDGSVHPDDTSTCDRCGRTLCSDCSCSCDGCGNTHCRWCLDEIDRELLCHDCVGTCSTCHATRSVHELDDHDGLCTECNDLQHEEIDDETTQEDPTTHQPDTTTTTTASTA